MGIIAWGTSGGGGNPNPTANQQLPPPDPTSNLPQAGGGLPNWFAAVGDQLGQPQTDIAQILNLIANGGFVAEIITNNNLNTRQTYTSVTDFLAALYALRNPDPNASPFVYRITYRDAVAGQEQLVQSPWVRIGTNLYVTGFNHFTWDLSDARWYANPTTYPPGGLRDGTINVGTIRSAFQAADNWAAMGGRGGLPSQAWVLIALFSEGARFEVVGAMLATVLAGNAETPPYFNWNNLQIMLLSWQTITNRMMNHVDFAQSWSYTVELLRGLQQMPSLNAAQEREALAWDQIELIHIRIAVTLEPNPLFGLPPPTPDPTTWSNWDTPPQLAVVAADRDVAAK